MPAQYAQLDIHAAVFEHSPLPMLIADDEGRFVEINAAAEPLFGCTRESIIGRKITDFVSPMHLKPTNRLWDSFLEAGAQEGTFTISRENGTDRVVRYVARTNFMPGLHLSIVRDVTGG